MGAGELGGGEGPLGQRATVPHLGRQHGSYVVVVTRASAGELQLMDTLLQTQTWRVTRKTHRTPQATTASTLLQHGRLTRCLVDCCHYVTNWWIINQNTRRGSRPKALRLSQPISRLPLESRITLETEVLAESKVGNSTAVTQSVWVYVTVAFGRLESSYAKWFSSFDMFPLEHFSSRKKKTRIAAELLSNMQIKWVVKLQIYSVTLFFILIKH